MVKTFLVSPLVGAITAVLGWTCAILLMSVMDDATFNSLRFGWAGLMVGSVALVAILLIIAMDGMVEPMVSVLVAAAGTALLWGRQELPIAANRYQADTPAYYWATITMMAVILLLLFMGLRAARMSNRRARG